MSAHTYPSFSELRVGESFTLKKKSKNHKKPIWVFNNGPLSDTFPYIITSYSITIVNATIEDGGLYSAYFRTNKNPTRPIISSAYIIIKGKLVIKLCVTCK